MCAKPSKKTPTKNVAKIFEVVEDVAVQDAIPTGSTSSKGKEPLASTPTNSSLPSMDPVDVFDSTITSSQEGSSACMLLL